jgi:hypothetical protein
MIKFDIMRYDSFPEDHEGPLTWTKIDEFTLSDDFADPNDYLGENRYKTLVSKCSAMGYRFRFYTLRDKGGYEVFVF